MGIAGKQMAHEHRRVIKQSVGMGGIKKGSHPGEKKERLLNQAINYEPSKNKVHAALWGISMFWIQ